VELIEEAREFLTRGVCKSVMCALNPSANSFLEMFPAPGLIGPLAILASHQINDRGITSGSDRALAHATQPPLLGASLVASVSLDARAIEAAASHSVL
jgi:hypothetical protein